MNLIPKKIYLDNIFDSLFDAKTNNDMKCDIYELDGIYHIDMDIPGFEKKDINIECKDGYLIISAEKEQETNDENKNYIRRERTYGKYERSFYIGEIENDNIKASFTNGILSITVPKKELVENKKIIEIE